eukprot:gene4928-9927_t
MAHVDNLDDAIRGLRANTLGKISLNDNKIGDPGATALAGALKQNSSVKIIGVADVVVVEAARSCIQTKTTVSIQIMFNNA